ncbi:MAG: adenylyltransferase/cytidyltransferase family protein [Crocinitomix sp.]|nr:adenylyltransferase/cytidyltransferase family protein [Crocinitomix sp.]
MSHLQKLNQKILNESQLIIELEACKVAGKKVVFTNGCFDILHKGHVSYLAAAADCGDVLVLALNSDDSVKLQGKGEDRPINKFDARSTIIAGLGFVDYVIEFDADTPLDMITRLKPDVLVKGGDYNPAEEDKNSKQYIVGREVVLANNGEVKTIDLVDGFSTTGLINKLKK